MSKKKKRNRPAEPARTPGFAVGAKVRVKNGVKDPDAPDMPIGGWCGTVTEVDFSVEPPGYLLEWDRRTLEGMHPVFVKRCQRDDLEVDSMWLDGNDLEPDTGELLPIEQPGAIVTLPLRPEDQDDRVRVALGLTSDDPLPEVDDESLARYHAFLAARLQFPFDARVLDRTGARELRERRLKVEKLLPPEEAGPAEGLLVGGHAGAEEAELPLWMLAAADEVEHRRLIQDYAYWFVNWGTDANLLPFPGWSEDEARPAGPALSFWRMLNVAGMLGAAYGATTGALLAVLESARTGCAVGAGVLGVLLGLAGRRYGTLVGPVYRSPRGGLLGFLLGGVLGALLGALGGALAVAYLGTIPGSIGGVVLGGMLARQGSKVPAKFLGGVFGACLGGIVLAFVKNAADALPGLATGAIAGAFGAALLLVLAIIGLAATVGTSNS